MQQAYRAGRCGEYGQSRGLRDCIGSAGHAELGEGDDCGAARLQLFRRSDHGGVVRVRSPLVERLHRRLDKLAIKLDRRRKFWTHGNEGRRK